MSRWIAALLALSFSASAPMAKAAPPERAMREQLLKKLHTGFIVELGELLELDTPGTIKLSERLQPFDTQRIQLRMETYDSMEQLKHICKGKGDGDPLELARRVAQNRVKIAQVDQAELEELVKGLPPEKVAKAAVFIVDFTKRIERMARDILKEHMQNQSGGEGGAPGPGGPGHGDDFF